MNSQIDVVKMVYCHTGARKFHQPTGNVGMQYLKAVIPENDTTAVSR
jgi:hypothetical protein